MPRVRIRDSFRVDVRAQIAWLRRHRDASWVAGLRDGLREVRTLLMHYPAAGSVLDDRDGLLLRKLILRRLPFVVIYAHEDKDVLWLLRLFHHRQDRSRVG